MGRAGPTGPWNMSLSWHSRVPWPINLAHRPCCAQIRVYDRGRAHAWAMLVVSALVHPNFLKIFFVSFLCYFAIEN